MNAFCLTHTRFDRFYFADAYHHGDGSEPLMNEPHGYLTNDDVKGYFHIIFPLYLFKESNHFFLEFMIL